MDKNQPWDILRFTGSQGTWNDKTHENTTAVEDSGFRKGIPTVKFTTTATHYISVGSAVVVKGSTNYDGTYKALAGTASALIYVPARYVAETPTNATTFKLTLAPGHAFEFGGFRLTLDAAAATASENLTITVDAEAAVDVYDHILYSQDMNTIKNLTWNIQDEPELFDKGDELICAWANGDDAVYALELFWRRR